MINSIHPFNNPELIQKSIQDFKNIDWVGQTYTDIIAEYLKRFLVVPTYLNTVKKGTILFRARKNEGKNESLFKNFKDLSIIPKEYVKSLGRANLPNQSVFYCSTTEETVVREVTQWYINDNGRAQDLFTKNVMSGGWNPFTSFMTISAWLVKEDLNLALLFGNEENRSKEIIHHAKERIALISDDNENYYNSKNQIIDFFSNEFGKLNVKHTSEYLYSALYASEIMANRPYLDNHEIKYDGVKYASIANNYRGENIAISENSFNRKIEFLGANYCYTTNNHEGKINTKSNVLIGRDYFAMTQQDGTFDWLPCSDDFDYVIYKDKKINLLKLENHEYRCCKAVKRIDPDS